MQKAKLKIILLTHSRLRVCYILEALESCGVEIAGVYFADCANSSMMELFRKREIRILSSLQNLKEFKASAIFSYGYTKKIEQSVIDSVDYCINFHPGILPDFKGCYTLYFALMQDIKHWGVSAHFVTGEFDCGDIIYIEKFDLQKYQHKTGGEISRYIWEVIGIKALKKVIFMILNDTLKAKKQESSGNYYSKKMLLEQKRVSLAELETKNYNEIVKKINALWYPPYDGAYLELSGGGELFLIPRKIWDEIKNKL